MLGLKSNLNVPQGGALGGLADEIIVVGREHERPLSELARISEAFYAELERYPEGLAAADQLGAPPAVELLKFLRDEVVDNDLRDLVDSGAEEQAGLGEAVMALLKVHTVLKPLLRGTPPATLHGSAAGALDMLQQQLRTSEMAGGELSSLLEQCSAHLHALRRAYKSLTEKGEQSKETIAAVIERGTFVFGASALTGRRLPERQAPRPQVPVLTSPHCASCAAAHCSRSTLSAAASTRRGSGRSWRRSSS